MDLDLGSISCPHDRCSGTVKASLDDLAQGRTKSCSRGHRIKLVDRGGGARRANESMKDLDKALGKLSRTTIRL